jgi:hypothetical protein
MVWVSRILAVTAVMVLPGLAGQWLDKRLATGFLGFVGFAFGLVSGMAYLLIMTKLPRAGSGGQSGGNAPEKDKD